MKKISVIMPSLNVVDYIKESVESVMKQSLSDLEILCIDAGSTDGTKEIIEQLAKKDKRIRVIDSEKRSYGYQVNKGIELAEGEYIAIVETDDYISPDMYEKLYKCAEEHSVDYVKANYRCFVNQENSDRFYLDSKIFSDVTNYNKVIYPREICETIYGDWFVWTGIYRKQFLLDKKIKLNETKGAAYQDIGFLHKIHIHAKKALYMNEYGYNYCLDRETSSTNSGKGLIFAYNEYRCLLEEFDAKDNSDQSELYPLYVRMAKSFVVCYRDILMNDLSKDVEAEEKIKWFREQLFNAVKCGIISESNTDEYIWKNLSRVLSLCNDYEMYLQEKEKELVLHIGLPGEKDVVIFCCGNYGFNAYKYLSRKGYKLVAFTDNNSAVLGKKLFGIPIKKPKEVLCLDANVRYVIANEKYYDEIKNQILDEGINEEYIYIFNM